MSGKGVTQGKVSDLCLMHSDIGTFPVVSFLKKSVPLSTIAGTLRIEHPGAWYHVMNRGACRQPIFNCRHLELFLDLLAEISLKFNIEVHAYCLMDNHYHLLLHTPIGNLSKAMQHLSSLYTVRYNGLEKRTDGPSFRGRFKSKNIESENYLIRVSRYIHLNPYHAKMLKMPEHYEWSSFAAYINKANSPAWLHKAETMCFFESSNIPKEIYRFTMEGDLDEFEQSTFLRSHPPLLVVKNSLKVLNLEKSTILSSEK